MKTDTIFLFCYLNFINYFNLLGGIHDYFGEKILKTKVVFMKCEKKYPPGDSAEPSAPRFALRSGPQAQPSHQVVSIYFYFALHETTLVSRFLAKIVVKPPRRLKKINETRSQKKKIRFPFKTINFQIHLYNRWNYQQTFIKFFSGTFSKLQEYSVFG